MTIHLAERVRFGIFELNLRTGELVSKEADRDGSPSQKVLLREQPFQILRILLERRGKIVSREEIRRALWPEDTIVGFDHGINVAMAILRKAVGDTAESPKYIETLPRRGYRLLVPVEWQESVREAPKTLENGVTSPLAQPIRGGGLTGKRISHYRVLEVLGGGGMGVVYKAEDLKLGRPVALKFLPEEMAGHERAIQRFKREAQTASALNHPNICTIYQIDEYEDKPFIAMEWLDGETLSTHLAAAPAPLPLAEALDIALQICSALEVAHAGGIIHRDIKPANVFLTKSGFVKILDFGLAKPTFGEEEQGTTATGISSHPSGDAEVSPSDPEDHVSLSLTGAALGTTVYMSPEQIRKEKLDPRTDLFSFGLVLYEMTAGARAFHGNSVGDIHEAILCSAPVVMREIKASIPRRLNTILSKALKKDRTQRYQSATEMRKDLLRVQQELCPVGHSARNWLVTAASLLVLLTAGAIYWRMHDGITLASSDTLVRTDMDNRTGDKALGDGMDLALQIALEQTPYLNLLGGDKVHEALRVLGLDEDSKVTPQIALRICRQTNSRAVISAFVADMGNRFRVGLNVMDCSSGKILEQIANIASNRDDLVRTLGLSAAQLRVKLGESKDSLRKFNQPLDQAASPSPDALAFLNSGYKKQLSGDLPGALGDYQRAIEKDPNFALAYAAEGDANDWLLKPTLASLYYSKAFDMRDQLTAPSRFQVENLYYAGRKDWDKACVVAEKWVQTFPRDVIARTNFNVCLDSIGHYDKALVQAREAARLLPSDPTLNNLLVTAIFAQRFDEAQEAYNEAVAHGFDSPNLHKNHAWLAILQNDQSGMQKEWAWASQDPVRGRVVLYMESKVESFYGRARNADRLALTDAESSMKAGLSSDAAATESEAGLWEAENGNSGQAQLMITDARKKSQDRISLIYAAFTLARAGNTAQSEKLADTLNQRFPDDFSVRTFVLPCVRAAIKLSENDASAAIKLLQPVEPYDFAPTDTFSYGYPAYLRGLAYLQLKQGSLAADQFQKVLDHSGAVEGFITGSLSTLQLARAQMLMRDVGAARKSYKEFLALWKNADPGLPVYKEAQKEYASLRNLQ